jgi:hypothetical protein
MIGWLVVWSLTPLSIIFQLYRGIYLVDSIIFKPLWGRRGRDQMVVGFTTTYAISVDHHICCEFESRSGRGVQHYIINFFRDLSICQSYSQECVNITLRKG